MSARQVQGHLFGGSEEVAGVLSPNPMVRRFGPGPEGAVCRDCRWLHAFEYSRVYYKCELRGISHGPATDHRVRWPACGQFTGM
jgi:hypothetical protein